MVLLRNAENGFFLVGRRLRQRRRAGAQDPRSSRRDPTEVGGNRDPRRRALNMHITEQIFVVVVLFFQNCVLCKRPRCPKFRARGHICSMQGCVEDTWKKVRDTDSPPLVCSILGGWISLNFSVSVQSHSGEAGALNTPAVHSPPLFLGREAGSNPRCDTSPSQDTYTPHSRIYRQFSVHLTFIDLGCEGKPECLEKRENGN